MPNSPIVLVIVGLLIVSVLLSSTNVNYLSFEVGKNSVVIDRIIFVDKPRITYFFEQLRIDNSYTIDKAEITIYDNTISNCSNRTTQQLDYNTCGIHKQLNYGIHPGRNVKLLNIAVTQYNSIDVEVKILVGYNNQSYAQNRTGFIYG